MSSHTLPFDGSVKGGRHMAPSNVSASSRVGVVLSTLLVVAGAIFGAVSLQSAYETSNGVGFDGSGMLAGFASTYLASIACMLGGFVTFTIARGGLRRSTGVALFVGVIALGLLGVVEYGLWSGSTAL